jgi:hypothetical protein
MTCKNNLCRGNCVSPWACGWKDNYSQGATVENGVETPLPGSIHIYEPMPVSGAWLRTIAVTVVAVGAFLAWALS